MSLPSQYSQPAKAAFKKLDEDHIWERHRSAARRLLSAVCFREHAQSTFLNTKSSLLPPIGFYYATFHAGISLLALDYATELTELRQMKHARLRNLVENRLEKRKVVSSELVKMIDLLRKYREYANYVFGGRLKRDAEFEALEIVPRLYDETSAFFHEVIGVLKELSALAAGPVGFPTPLQQLIGDHFGDDIIRRYLGKADEKRVWDYLLKQGITT